ncbi:pilus assembly protein TadG-related protein [Arthrobacter sp. CAN_A1]|uniref:pilus assembly protein TadG-related protein n=1 Tax=Arthrobacter sp. CAN_A1 TaxID=2787717 RepID=UPI0018CBD58F
MMTALLMVILLGMTAIVIDIGMVYAERAQLQSGADAAALAIAQDCAQGINCDIASATSTAIVLAGANANDNSAAAKVTREGTTFTVQTSTLTAGNQKAVQHWFAPILGINSTQVGATAKASWGSPMAGFAPFPMTFSTCEVKRGSGLQMVQFHKKNSSTPGCAGGPPGGFGKLDQDPGVCGATIDAAKGTAGSDTGNDVPSNCDSLLEGWAASIESGTYPVGIFPIYDSVSGNGSNATYGLSGFAAFEVHGWKWKQGGSKKDQFRADYYPGMDCGNDICLIGKFVKKVMLDDGYTLGPPNDLGITIVKLTG